jgi:hypothetical protein
MNKEKMTIIGAFLNPKRGVEDGDPRLENHFAVVSFVTPDRKVARATMRIYEAAELVFVPDAQFLGDMRLAENPRAFIKERETRKHKASWIASAQEYAATKAAEYQALHGAAPDASYVELWTRDGFRYAGQRHMATLLNAEADEKAEKRTARLCKRHAKWAFSMFQRTLADGSLTPLGYPNNVGGVVMVSGHSLEQVFSKRGTDDGYGIVTYPPVKATVWGEERSVFNLRREDDTVPLHISYLGMPYDVTEERMYNKLKVDEDLRLQFLKGEV